MTTITTSSTMKTKNRRNRKIEYETTTGTRTGIIMIKVTTKITLSKGLQTRMKEKVNKRTQ